jgi:hypothetical protein
MLRVDKRLWLASGLVFAVLSSTAAFARDGGHEGKHEGDDEGERHRRTQAPYYVVQPPPPAVYAPPQVIYREPPVYYQAPTYSAPPPPSVNINIPLR